MAHRMMKYRLAADGTVPTFLCLHPEGVGGVFVVADPSTPSPRDMVMVGISETDDIGDAEAVATKADLLAYLTTVGANWTQPDPAQPGNPKLLFLLTHRLQLTGHGVVWTHLTQADHELGRCSQGGNTHHCGVPCLALGAGQ
jgi:hypothetical protein